MTFSVVRKHSNPVMTLPIPPTVHGVKMKLCLCQPAAALPTSGRSQSHSKVLVLHFLWRIFALFLNVLLNVFLVFYTILFHFIYCMFFQICHIFLHSKFIKGQI